MDTILAGDGNPALSGGEQSERVFVVGRCLDQLSDDNLNRLLTENGAHSFLVANYRFRDHKINFENSWRFQ